jgi:energy-converting hydrogenase A subunit M
MLVNPNAREPALDYINIDPYSNQHFLKNMRSGKMVHDYREEDRRRMLTVKLKNAIMICWLDVKMSRAKPNFEELIKNYISQRKQQAENPEFYKNMKKKEKLERKERLRLEEQEKKREVEAHLTSYVN